MCAAAVVLLLFFTSLICFIVIFTRKRRNQGHKKGTTQYSSRDDDVIPLADIDGLDFIPSTRIDEEDNVSIDKKDTDDFYRYDEI